MPNSNPVYQELKNACTQYRADIVAVSKYRTIEQILQVYHLGQRKFGENRVQELIAKAPELPNDIEWHLIGHLQTNKVKDALLYAHWIHSLDREKLWVKLQDEAEKSGTRMRCLLQIKIAREESKYGWDYEELQQLLKARVHLDRPNIILSGVMGMATLTDDDDQVRAEFRRLRAYFEELKSTYFAKESDFSTISMGMSGDYPIALEEGSTMVRVGSLIFDGIA